MPSNYTTNYQLSQWEADDRVLRTDFNADNAKIDAALKAEAGARTALEDKLNLKGNCRIWTTSYVGNGQYGESHPNRVEFPWTPTMVMVIGDNGFLFTMFYGARSGMVHAGAPSFSPLTWTERSVQWWSNHYSPQMNDSNALYFVVAFGML